MENNYFTTIIIGDELFSGKKDENGPAVDLLLKEIGLQPRTRLIVKDVEADIQEGVKRALGKSRLVLCCGGLGPTQDDVTRQAVAKGIGRKLSWNKKEWEKLENRLKKITNLVSQSNRQQTWFPEKSTILKNSVGTAPGFIVRAKSNSWVAAVPGPPRECVEMVKKALLPYLRKQTIRGAKRERRRVLRVAGLAESALQEKLGPLFPNSSPMRLGFILDGPGEILITLSISENGRKDSERLRAGVRRIIGVLGENVVDAQAGRLEEAVGKFLKKTSTTLAVAESCTGGIVAQRITSVPGSSSYFKLGVVTYGNQSKSDMLAIPQALIQKHGAVSREVALAMARAIKRKGKADWGMGITGIAGPAGGTARKPVGLVHIALCRPDGSLEDRVARFFGRRGLIQQRSAAAGLDWLRRELLKVGRNGENRENFKKANDLE